MAEGKKVVQMKKSPEGKQVPEKQEEQKPRNRIEELQLSMKALQERLSESNGLADRAFETNWMLNDINQTAAISIDIQVAIFNKLCETLETQSGLLREIRDLPKKE